MGVIALDEDGPVWGASSGLIHSMLESFIRSVGRKDYLDRFIKKFDYGYNSIRLSEIDVNQLEEFRTLVSNYIECGEFTAYSNNDEETEIITGNLKELQSMIDAYIVKRRHS